MTTTKFKLIPYAGYDPREYSAQSPRQSIRPPRRSVRSYMFNGELLTVKEIAAKTGRDLSTIYEKVKVNTLHELEAQMKRDPKPRTWPYSVKHTFKGETHSLRGWAQRVGLIETTIRERLTDMAWPLAAALSLPVEKTWAKARRGKVLARLLDGFNAPSAAAVTPPPRTTTRPTTAATTTGGQSKTLERSRATGPVPQNPVLFEVTLP